MLCHLLYESPFFLEYKNYTHCSLQSENKWMCFIWQLKSNGYESSHVRKYHNILIHEEVPYGITSVFILNPVISSERRGQCLELADLVCNFLGKGSVQLVSVSYFSGNSVTLKSNLRKTSALLSVLSAICCMLPATVGRPLRLIRVNESTKCRHHIYQFTIHVWKENTS